MIMKKQTFTINQIELIILLKGVKKPTFTNIVSETIPSMKKTDNPYIDKVTKVSKGNYFIGGSYEDMVKTRIFQEGLDINFESMECSVGHKVEDSICLQFNDNLQRWYLQYFIFPTSNIKSEYKFLGNPIEKVMLEDYLSKKSTTSRQPQENKHKVQSFKIESIKEISLNGNHYVIE
jgi:hypothetical protein